MWHRALYVGVLLAASAACAGSGSDVPRTGVAPAVSAAGAEGRAGQGVPPPRPVPSAAAAADGSQELHAELMRLIGPAACREDSHCRALPLGAKPCGGPEGYVAWSTVGTDSVRLQAVAERYRVARAARNQRLGLVSDCAVVMEPPVRCVPDAASPLGGRCQAQAGRGGPALLTR